MSQKRAIRVVATSARLLAGAVVAVACVAGVTAAVALPWPGVVKEPAQVAVTPTAGDTTLVCGGPFRAIGRDVQNAQQMSSAGTPDLTADSVGPRDDSQLSASDLVGAASGPDRFIGSAEEGGVALIAAAESISLAAEDLSGFAAGACREPSTESWLVGGTVETGASDLVIMSNPGDVAATASLTVYGLEQTTTTTVVPAGEQVAVPLSSIAAGIQQPVVRVTAEGAPLRAVLQSSLVRTLDPSGADLQDTAGAPRADLTFAGVQVITSDADSAVTVLRIMATTEAAEATVTVRSESEQVQQVTVPLDAGTPAEVNLDDLEAGVYSVEVEAGTPVVGAVWQTTRLDAGADFAWMTPAREISGEVLMSVPTGPDPRLHLVNSANADATATLTATTGDEEQITVPAGGSTIVEVSEDTNYTLSTESTLSAAVMMAGTDELAGWPVWPGAAAQDAITVYP